MSKEQEDQPQALTLKDIVQAAKESALRDGRQVAPFVVAEGSRNFAMIPIDELSGVFQERIRQMRSVGFITGQAGSIGELQQIFFISEGWMSVSEKGEQPVIPPEEDPARIEILFVMHLLVTKQQSNIVYLEMIRNPEGRLVALKEMEDNDESQGGKFSSPLLAAFVEGFHLGARKGGN